MSSSRRSADGQPFGGEIVAVVDESAPRIGTGVYYILSCVVVKDAVSVSEELSHFFDQASGRKNPFHWHKEGPDARSRIVRLILDSGASASSYFSSVGLRGQATARQKLLSVVVEELRGMKVDHLAIESGDAATNSRDQATLLNYFRGLGGVPFRFDWRTKQERLLWLADALSGIAHDSFVASDRVYLDRLLAANTLESEPQRVE